MVGPGKLEDWIYKEKTMPQITIDVGGTVIDIKDLTNEEIDKLVSALHERKVLINQNNMIRVGEDKLWEIFRKSKKPARK